MKRLARNRQTSDRQILLRCFCTIHTGTIRIDCLEIASPLFSWWRSRLVVWCRTTNASRKTLEPREDHPVSRSQANPRSTMHYCSLKRPVVAPIFIFFCRKKNPLPFFLIKFILVITPSYPKGHTSCHQKVGLLGPVSAQSKPAGLAASSMSPDHDSGTEAKIKHQSDNKGTPGRQHQAWR